MTAIAQLDQSNQLSVPGQDDCKTIKDTMLLHNKDQIKSAHPGSNNKQGGQSRGQHDVVHGFPEPGETLTQSCAGKYEGFLRFTA